VTLARGKSTRIDVLVDASEEGNAARVVTDTATMSFARHAAREGSPGKPGALGAAAAPGKRTQVDMLPELDEVELAPGPRTTGMYGAATGAGAPAPVAARAAAGRDAGADREIDEDEDGEGPGGPGRPGRPGMPGLNDEDEGEVVSAAIGSSEEADTAASDEDGGAESAGDESSSDELSADDAAAGEDQSARGPENASSAPQGSGHIAATGDAGAPAGSGTGKATARASRVDPPIGGTPAIRSSTVKSAPSGADDTRTKIGVGEVVRLVGSLEGSWSTNRGKLQRSYGMNTTWTAPATPGTATIKLSGGGKSTTKKFTIIAPNRLSMKKVSEDSWPKGVQGVGMITNVTIGPTSVNFGNLEWLEVPGPASNRTGYFTKYKPLYHHPNPKWLPWNDSNTGLTDHASLFEWPRPWSPGGFQWNIPNKYRVTGVGGSGHVFTTTHQIFRMTNKKGTTTITKAGAKVTRTP
jgi:hypothetical protein